jgi:hypothetical protein
MKSSADTVTSEFFWQLLNPETFSPLYRMETNNTDQLSGMTEGTKVWKYLGSTHWSTTEIPSIHQLSY